MVGFALTSYAIAVERELITREEAVLSRLYRDVPVNSIWEGCGNVQCLDVLRAINHDREILEVVLYEIRAAVDGKRLLRLVGDG